jgi:hypothetical protein
MKPGCWKSVVLDLYRAGGAWYAFLVGGRFHDEALP